MRWGIYRMAGIVGLLAFAHVFFSRARLLLQHCIGRCLQTVWNATVSFNRFSQVPALTPRPRRPFLIMVCPGMRRRDETVQLEACDAIALGNTIFAANAGAWSKSQGNACVTPLEANGRVYVGAYKTVTVVGPGR